MKKKRSWLKWVLGAAAVLWLPIVTIIYSIPWDRIGNSEQPCVLLDPLEISIIGYEEYSKHNHLTFGDADMIALDLMLSSFSAQEMEQYPYALIIVTLNDISQATPSQNWITLYESELMKNYAVGQHAAESGCTQNIYTIAFCLPEGISEGKLSITIDAYPSKEAFENSRPGSYNSLCTHLANSILYVHRDETSGTVLCDWQYYERHFK